MEWAASSSDLKPIEHLRDQLGRAEADPAEQLKLKLFLPE